MKLSTAFTILAFAWFAFPFAYFFSTAISHGVAADLGRETVADFSGGLFCVSLQFLLNHFWLAVTIYIAGFASLATVVVALHYKKEEKERKVSRRVGKFLSWFISIIVGIAFFLVGLVAFEVPFSACLDVPARDEVALSLFVAIIAALVSYFLFGLFRKMDLNLPRR